MEMMMMMDLVLFAKENPYSCIPLDAFSNEHLFKHKRRGNRKHDGAPHQIPGTGGRA
jgi:hypothetical protein